MARQTFTYMTTAEAADFLGVSIATVTRLAKSGDLAIAHQMPGTRGARLFTRDEVTRLAVEKELAP